MRSTVLEESFSNSDMICRNLDGNIETCETNKDLNDEDVHRCPNGDVSACEFCELLNLFCNLWRTFKLRSALESANLIDECKRYVESIRNCIGKLKPHLQRYDFDEHTKANGYRTFVFLAKRAVKKCLYIANELNESSRICTPKTHPDLFEKLIDWNRIFFVLSSIMSCLVDFVNEDKAGSLFTSSRVALNRFIAMSVDRVNVVGFQGKLLGFQFCKSVRNPLWFISTLMAAYSEIYQSEGFFRSSFASSKAFIYYWRNPSERADRIAKICAEDPLNFFKQFWLMQEKGLPRIVSNCLGEPVDTNLEISIPPVHITLKTKSGKELRFLPPFEYVGVKPIMLRLISHKIRPGAVGSGQSVSASTHEKLSNTLVIHCHGGGFVAQSSNSHLVYLKSFARGVGAPIISVDYSLSPEAPYPRALHEAFYTYLWALENSHLLGSTAEKIILTGDSAGGFILTGVTLLCIEFGIRVPDGLLLVYTPQLLESAVSPARLLSIADPLIPYPALAACLGAYVGKTFKPELAKLPGCFVDGPWEPEEYSNTEVCSRKFVSLDLEELDEVHLPQDDWHLSPLIAPDYILAKFPPTSLVTTAFDPCQDDCVEFGKRLKGLGVPTTLDVLSSLPHGFLNFSRVSPECYQGVEVCFRRLKDFC